MRRILALAVVAAAVSFGGGCSPPKYVTYSSVAKDWKAAVPWGWSVMFDREQDHYAATNLIGPFEPDFYLGAPSLSVRWHRYSHAHRLADGLFEVYSSADDFVAQMLETVYGPEYELRRSDGKPGPGRVEDVLLAGRRAKQFTVLSPARVPDTTKWGTAIDPQSGRLAVIRMHQYIVLPLERGFYVLVYPSTREGFKLYLPQFNQLLQSFTPLTQGPNGPPLEPVSGGKQAAVVRK